MDHLLRCGRRPILGQAILLAAGIVLCWLALGFAAGQAEAASPEQSVTTRSGSEDSGKDAAKGIFEALQGRWRRPDGGYVIDIKNIDSAGVMDAAYFNPRPIRVARAQATQEGQIIKVFVELRDVGYPGSTYTLTYDPQTDRLNGVYFQAAMQQSFDVTFFKMK